MLKKILLIFLAFTLYRYTFCELSEVYTSIRDNSTQCNYHDYKLFMFIQTSRDNMIYFYIRFNKKHIMYPSRYNLNDKEEIINYFNYTTLYTDRIFETDKDSCFELIYINNNTLNNLAIINSYRKYKEIISTNIYDKFKILCLKTGNSYNNKLIILEIAYSMNSSSNFTISMEYKTNITLSRYNKNSTYSMSLFYYFTDSYIENFYPILFVDNKDKNYDKEFVDFKLDSLPTTIFIENNRTIGSFGDACYVIQYRNGYPYIDLEFTDDKRQIILLNNKIIEAFEYFLYKMNKTDSLIFHSPFESTVYISYIITKYIYFESNKKFSFDLLGRATRILSFENKFQNEKLTLNITGNDTIYMKIIEKNNTMMTQIRTYNSPTNNYTINFYPKGMYFELIMSFHSHLKSSTKIFISYDIDNIPILKKNSKKCAKKIKYYKIIYQKQSSCFTVTFEKGGQNSKIIIPSTNTINQYLSPRNYTYCIYSKGYIEAFFIEVENDCFTLTFNQDNVIDKNQDNDIDKIFIIIIIAIFFLLISVIIFYIIKKRRKNNSIDILLDENKLINITDNDNKNIQLLTFEENDNEIPSSLSEELEKENNREKNKLTNDFETNDKDKKTPKSNEKDINEPLINENNTKNEKKIFDIKNEKTVSKINETMNSDLLLDIWENDEGEPIIDEKINTMLNKYFLKKGKMSGICESEHLSINCVEIKDFIESSKYTYDKVNEIYKNYSNYYEKMTEKNKKNENNLNPLRSGIFDYIQLSIFVILLILVIMSFSLVTIIILLIVYSLGIFIQLKYVNFFNKKLWQKLLLSGNNLKKLKEILNAKPYLELYFKNEKILTIPYLSYADISGIMYKNGIIDENASIYLEKVNLEDFSKIYFPLKYLFFVDSTKEYFKFLITQFHKYCRVKSTNDIGFEYEKMHLKYYLKTKSNEIIDKNDPFFINCYFTCQPKYYSIISIILLLTQSSTIFGLLLDYFKTKIIEIKKTVSIKNNLEEFLNLKKLFLRIILSNKKIRREKTEIIGEKEAKKKEFIDLCVDLTNKIKKEMIEDESKEKKPIKKVIYDKETKGYLTPFNCKCGYDSFLYYSPLQFEKSYGTKTKKILGNSNFYNIIDDDPYLSLQQKTEIYKKEFENLGGDIFENKFSNDINIDDHDNDNNNIKSNENNKNDKIKKQKIKQIIYTERTLILKIMISKDFVDIHYNIKKSNGLNNNGKFKLYKHLEGFDKLEEKVNLDWTKSEIYIPGCKDIIQIIRKKKGIKLSSKNFEIISDTHLNDDLHSGLPSWVNSDDWSEKEIKRCVKNCELTSKINRFKVLYG